jgi:hypothetical protein
MTQKTWIAVSALFLLSSVSYAADCDTQLTLRCQATYLEQGKTVQTLSQSSGLENEHWDEPSETNCAATVYFTQDLQVTSARIYAQKDLTSPQVTFEADAAQVVDQTVNGQTIRNAYYSNDLSVTSKVSDAANVGILHLVKPDGAITDIALSCVVD